MNLRLSMPLNLETMKIDNVFEIGVGVSAWLEVCFLTTWILGWFSMCDILSKCLVLIIQGKTLWVDMRDLNGKKPVQYVYVYIARML